MEMFIAIIVGCVLGAVFTEVVDRAEVYFNTKLN